MKKQYKDFYFCLQDEIPGFRFAQLAMLIGLVVAFAFNEVELGGGIVVAGLLGALLAVTMDVWRMRKLIHSTEAEDEDEEPEDANVPL